MKKIVGFILLLSGLGLRAEKLPVSEYQLDQINYLIQDKAQGTFLPSLNALHVEISGSEMISATALHFRKHLKRPGRILLPAVYSHLLLFGRTTTWSGLNQDELLQYPFFTGVSNGPIYLINRAIRI